jgi:drug/metabolite transporter superfamily protein YnfA
MMAEIIYVLCAGTSIFCALLLLRSYLRHRTRLLLLSMICFLGLAVNSVIVFIDLAVLPAVDLRLVRTLAAFGSIFIFLVGLIWESR